MAKRQIIDHDVKPKHRAAITPESREQQLCSLAVDLAEEQLRDGTASSQVITHFLRLATEKEKLEREKLQKENQLLNAKTNAIESGERSEALYEEVLNAFQKYAGKGGEDEGL